MAKRKKTKKDQPKKKRVVYVRRRPRRKKRVGLPANGVVENNQFRQLDSRLAGMEGRQYEQIRSNYNSRTADFEKAQKVQNSEFQSSIQKLFQDSESRVKQQLAKELSDSRRAHDSLQGETRAHSREVAQNLARGLEQRAAELAPAVRTAQESPPSRRRSPSADSPGASAFLARGDMTTSPLSPSTTEKRQARRELFTATGQAGGSSARRERSVTPTAHSSSSLKQPRQLPPHSERARTKSRSGTPDRSSRSPVNP